MKMNTVVCGLFVAASVGCTTVDPRYEEIARGKTNLTRFDQEAPSVLKHYQEMKTLFGLPDEERAIVDERVVVWKNNTVTGGNTIILYGGAVHTTPVAPISCELTAVVDDDGAVSNIDLGGNSGACWYFSNKFVEWTDSID